MNNQGKTTEEMFAANAQVLGNAVYASVSQLYSKGFRTINPSLIQLAVGCINGFDKMDLIEGFITNSHEHCWDQIKRRNEEYFVENAGTIFQYLPMDKVNLFKDLFTTKDSSGKRIVSEVIISSIWSIFDALIKISIKHVHLNRKPSTRVLNGKEVKGYSNPSYMKDVNLAHHANIWKVSLDFPCQI